jgi:hypothetical protein
VTPLTKLPMLHICHAASLSPETGIAPLVAAGYLRVFLCGIAQSIARILNDRFSIKVLREAAP